MRHARAGAQPLVAEGLRHGPRRREALAAALAVAMLALSSVASILEQSRVDDEMQAAAASAGPAAAAGGAPATTLIAAYGGLPYTHPSDVVIERAGVHDLRVKDVAWEGRPFKSPIYYGIRIARWPENAALGGMVDFTHAKAIAPFGDTAALQGTLFGEKAPDKVRIGELFRHLEFSHGHNMLTLNGVYRLPRIAARLVPYVGLGAGGAVPHTEIAFNRENVRTYEYQYAGPVGQALAGIEIRLGRQVCFIEYKLTLADYEAPLSQQEGSLAVTDLWRQLRGWLSGAPPPGGSARTRLVSHQLIGGLGIRTGAAAAAP